MQIDQPTTTELPEHWSGPNPIPTIGTIVGAPFSNQILATDVVGYFTLPGTYQDRPVLYKGVKLRLLELPKEMGSFGISSAFFEKLETHGGDAFQQRLSEEEPFVISLFGAEIKEAPPLPKWYEEHKLTAKAEFAALAAIVLGGKEWEPTLTITAWSNGQWRDTPYHELSGILQQIRNTGQFKYIEHARKKNPGFLKACKTAVAKHRSGRGLTSHFPSLEH